MLLLKVAHGTTVYNYFDESILLSTVKLTLYQRSMAKYWYQKVALSEPSVKFCRKLYPDKSIISENQNLIFE